MRLVRFSVNFSCICKCFDCCVSTILFHFQGIFFKDSNSLAFYNMLSGAMVQLQLKERGGRKK